MKKYLFLQKSARFVDECFKSTLEFQLPERWMSGLSRTPGKRVWVNSPPRVRIPPSPPDTAFDAEVFQASTQHLKQNQDVKPQYSNALGLFRF